jgi:hypothetical protein
LAWAAVAGLATGIPAQGQGPIRWEIDQTRSAIWWQINPHFGHLWATTCPNDETWAAGEGRSAQFRGKSTLDRKVRMTNVRDALDLIPLFPRDTARANCRRAVYGQVTIADTSSYRGVSGMIRVRSDSLTLGSDMRDLFAQKYIYKSSTFREISMLVDSITSVERGDTLRGMLFGKFQLRDVVKPIRVQFRAWDEPGGRRVKGQWYMTASTLMDEYRISRVYLAMGVASKLWDELHMGFDLVMKRSAVNPTDGTRGGDR